MRLGPRLKREKARLKREKAGLENENAGYLIETIYLIAYRFWYAIP